MFIRFEHDTSSIIFFSLEKNIDHDVFSPWRHLLWSPPLSFIRMKVDALQTYYTAVVLELPCTLTPGILFVFSFVGTPVYRALCVLVCWFTLYFSGIPPTGSFLTYVN